MIDTHSHIYMIEETPIEKVIKNALNNGVSKIIVPSAYPKDIDIVMELTQKYDNIYGLLGVHPSEVRDWTDDLIDKIYAHENGNIEIVFKYQDEYKNILKLIKSIYE